MNLNKLAAYFLPAFAMLAITALCLMNIFGSQEDSLAIFKFSLVIVFPLTLIVQGVACAIHKYNLIPALGLSIIAYVVVFVLILKTTSFNYIIYYAASFLLGYVVTLLIRRFKKTK